MILNDIFGKQHDIKYVYIELLNGSGDNEHGEPTLVLIGKYYNEDFSSNECMLERCIASPKNILRLLEQKESIIAKIKMVENVIITNES